MNSLLFGLALIDIIVIIAYFLIIIGIGIRVSKRIRSQEDFYEERYASMMAALMSTADALMLTVSGLLLHNVYRPLVRQKTEMHYVWAGRIFGAAFLIGGAIITTRFDNILEILKFVWEFFVIFAAAFWLGLKWRRANRQGAWASILLTLLIFYLLPMVIPNLIPSLRQNEMLLMETRPAPIQRNYTAREIDVSERTQEIEAWESLADYEKVHTAKPRTLTRGESFTKTFHLPAKTIFWSKQAGINAEGDMEDLERTYSNPEKTREQLLFPSTSLELYKWNRQDITGFLIAVGVVFVVIGTLFLVVTIGS